MSTIVRIGKILLFYVVFYATLSLFFAVMFAIFNQTLDETAPKLKLDSGLIGSNPGLGFKPMPPDSNLENTLIWYKTGEPKNVEYWIHELDNFLKPYYHQDESENNQNCEGDNKPADRKFCKFEYTRKFAPCTKKWGYGFGKKEGGPCIFLKLNKIFGWEPKYYTQVTAPDDMPKHLKQVIAQNQFRGKHRIIWVDCTGENPADIENIGPISYLPQRGFLDRYFPFNNVKGYVSPFVAVHFEKPRRGVIINIVCKAWAMNIHHDLINNRGSVHFQIMLD